MSAVIIPTPGRIVWYWPSAADGIATLPGGPLAAIVAGVHNDRSVNLAVIDSYGHAQQRINVRLVQPDDDIPDTSYASWMPYQLGQAAKTEELQEQLQGGEGPFAETDGTSASETGLVNTTPDAPDAQQQ